MNPFTIKKNRYKYGYKKEFYFEQFKKIESGFENAMRIDILDGSTVKDCRMYLNIFLKKNNLKAKTKVVDGVLWVAITES